MAILKIKAKKGSSLNSTVQALSEFIPEMMDQYKDRFELIHKGGGLMSAGDSHYVGIDLKLPDFSPEVMDEIMPLIRALLALIENQAEDGISAQIVMSDGQTEKIALVSGTEKVSFFDKMMRRGPDQHGK